MAKQAESRLSQTTTSEPSQNLNRRGFVGMLATLAPVAAIGTAVPVVAAAAEHEDPELLALGVRVDDIVERVKSAKQAKLQVDALAESRMPAIPEDLFARDRDDVLFRTGCCGPQTDVWGKELYDRPKLFKAEQLLSFHDIRSSRTKLARRLRTLGPKAAEYEKARSAVLAECMPALENARDELHMAVGELQCRSADLLRMKPKTVRGVMLQAKAIAAMAALAENDCFGTIHWGAPRLAQSILSLNGAAV